ncbi:KTSC domain-containing protein [Cohaesibacter sp. CAU 1516]|uniref:KTSC domain-containing protein n=1 Tax=Cohaesibacter sp. CAU 1516 TaxID=2576038 RepID=UPI0010FD0AD9|nr:KTSC domain-containing protein [Cohaesibacter sp. CAU 1516]TLP43431.1 KTSC domain-containing protein [Cohaesibacter sp. CAU 1516]
MPFVTSSAISRIEWEDGILSIWFKSTGRYDYPNVPLELFEAFLDAPSKGRFYNMYIRDKY